MWRTDEEFNKQVTMLIKHIQSRYYCFQMKVQKDLMAKVECKVHMANIIDKRIQRKRDLLKQLRTSIDPTDILARKISEIASKAQTLPVGDGPHEPNVGEYPLVPNVNELNGHSLGPFCTAPCTFEQALNC